MILILFFKLFKYVVFLGKRLFYSQNKTYLGPCKTTCDKIFCPYSHEQTAQLLFPLSMRSAFQNESELLERSYI